jgi:hypothetical protein
LERETASGIDWEQVRAEVARDGFAELASPCTEVPEDQFQASVAEGQALGLIVERDPDDSINVYPADTRDGRI